MGKIFLPLAVIASIALVASTLLLPSVQEQALMQLKNKQYQRAENTYKALYEEGDRSIDVIQSLAQLSLINGDPEQAAEYLKMFAESDPNNLEVKDYLGRLFRYAQRSEDYLANLENIVSLVPDATRLRELSHLYGLRQDYDRQIDVLKQLISIDPDTDSLRALLQLLARKERFGDLMDILENVAVDSDLYLDEETAMFAVEMYLLHQEPEKASAVVNYLLKVKPEPKVLLAIVDRARQHGLGEYAIRWMEPYGKWRSENQAVDETWVKLQIAEGDPDQILRVLSSRAANQGLPDYLVDEYIELLLQARQDSNFDRELRKVLAKELATGAKWKRDQLMYWLMDKGAADLLSGRIEELAYAGELNWHYEYLDRLVGEDQRLVQYAKHVVADPAYQPEVREQMAFTLLERGFRKAAERAFWDLAEDRPASHAVVRQLVYLWGPKPRAKARQWLRAKTKKAIAAQRGEWLKHLRQIEDWKGIAELAQPIGNGTESLLKIDALLTLKQVPEARKLLIAYLNGWVAVEELPEAAGYAEQLGLDSLAEQSLRRFLLFRPNSAPELRSIAMLAFRNGHPERALADFERFHQLEQGDFESHYYHARSLQEAGHVEKARRILLQALQSGALQGELDRKQRTILAQIHAQLGDTERALRLYAELVTE